MFLFVFLINVHTNLMTYKKGNLGGHFLFILFYLMNEMHWFSSATNVKEWKWYEFCFISAS